MRKAVFSALAMICAAAASHAQSATEDIARRTVERRAIEAVNWGIPAVNYDRMYQAMVRDAKGGFNQIVYWSGFSDWKNQTLTPNPDTIYLMPFFDNSKGAGPMVLEIPPALAGRVDHRHASWIAGSWRSKMSGLPGR